MLIKTKVKLNPKSKIECLIQCDPIFKTNIKRQREKKKFNLRIGFSKFTIKRIFFFIGQGT